MLGVIDAPPTQPTAKWSLLGLVAFRFSFAYWLLYNLDFPLGFIDLEGGLSEAYCNLWLPVINWVGGNVLRIPYEVTVLPNGSGDTTFNYVQVFCFAVLACLTALVWSLLDRKRASYPSLQEGLRVLLRYVLFITLLSYGLAKVFKAQFPEPGPLRLLETYGESSPMGLLWTFMGYSGPYTVFAGLAEVAGAVLLLARRTVMLGALVLAGVMVNVVMMNLSYDVPVKLYSSHLLLMALFLLLPDLKRLAGFFLLNKAVPPAQHRTDAPRPLLKKLHLGSKAAAIVAVLYLSFSDALATWSEYGDIAPKPALYGLWEVTSFRRNGVEVPPLITDSSRWLKVAIDTLDRFAIQAGQDPIKRGKITLHPATQELEIAWKEDRPMRFQYQKVNDQLLVLKQADGNLVVHLKQTDISQLPLLKRGFNLISEMPHNR